MIGDLPRGGSPLRLFCLPGGPLERSRRLLRPVAGRRLGAIQTVQSEPALEFGDPRRWSAAIGAISSSLDGSLGGSRILRMLDPKPSPPSRNIPPAKPDRDHLT
jgi:hypothetical protein